MQTTNINITKNSGKKSGFYSSIVTLIVEGGITFYRYLYSLGMSGEENMVVLSSRNNYYLEEDDLKNVRVLITLKKLNLIKHLDMYLNTLVRILPPDASIIGYFSDSKIVKNNRFPFHLLKFFTRSNIFFDFRTGHIMNKNEVTELLERSGLKTLDMRKMNGLIYFNSQIVNRPV